MRGGMVVEGVGGGGSKNNQKHQSENHICGKNLGASRQPRSSWIPKKTSTGKPRWRSAPSAYVGSPKVRGRHFDELSWARFMCMIKIKICLLLTIFHFCCVGRPNRYRSKHFQCANTNVEVKRYYILLSEVGHATRSAKSLAHA